MQSMWTDIKKKNTSLLLKLPHDKPKSNITPLQQEKVKEEKRDEIESDKKIKGERKIVWFASPPPEKQQPNELRDSLALMGPSFL